VVSVATAWEAMTEDRPHRPALTPLFACRQLVRGAGTQFETAVVAAAVSVLVPAVGLAAA
jgi:HD-GYP domain-containing protein (c-di-GMP phosphodiesterase class II)